MRSEGSAISGAAVLMLVLGVIDFGGLPEFLSLVPIDSPLRQALGGALVIDPLRRMLAAALVALLAYLMAAEVLDAGRRGAAEDSGRAERRRRAVAAILLLGLLVVPMTARVVQRFRAGTLEMTHDGGVLYAEAAIEALRRGENPYDISYAGGPLGEKFARDPYWASRPHDHILTFQPYLPLPFLAGLPLARAAEALGIPYDQRWLHLVHLIGLAWLLPRMTSHRRGSLLAVAVLLNPTFAHYFILGTNDVLLVFWVLLGLHWLGCRRPQAAAWAFGIAAATKQFAWLLLPLAAACLAPDSGAGWRGRARSLARGALRLWPVAVVLALSAGPFLIWNPAAFVEDAVLFNFGLTSARYPFGGTPGYGLANFVIGLGLIRSLADEFPLVIGTLAVFAPLYLVMLVRLIGRPQPALLAGAYGSLLFVFLLFSRMFHYNYFCVIAALLAVAWLGEWPAAAAAPAGVRSRRDQLENRPTSES